MGFGELQGTFERAADVVGAGAHSEIVGEGIQTIDQRLWKPNKDGTSFWYDGPCQSFDFEDNVNQQNGGQITLNPDADGWLEQWSAQNGPLGAGYTFYITGNTAPLGNPNAPFTLTPKRSLVPPVQTMPPFTVAVGTSGGCNLGPITGVAFSGFVLDSQGYSGLYGGYGGGLSAGAQCSVGIQASVSNGRSICAFGGPFYNLSGTGGFALAGTADYFIGDGDGPGGSVQGGGLTLGLGAGGSAAGTFTKTTIVPFGQQCTQDGKIQ